MGARKRGRAVGGSDWTLIWAFATTTAARVQSLHGLIVTIQTYELIGSERIAYYRPIVTIWTMC